MQWYSLREHHDDIAQETLLRLWEKWPRLEYDPDRGASVETFIYKVINNTLKDVLRKMKFIRNTQRSTPLPNKVHSNVVDMPCVITSEPDKERLQMIEANIDREFTSRIIFGHEMKKTKYSTYYWQRKKLRDV